MSQVIPVGVCKKSDNNEIDLEHTLKTIEERMKKVQSEANSLRIEVGNLCHENMLLDKQINCTKSLNNKLEIEIADVKTSTEGTACYVEAIKWKIYKTSLLKEFENENHEDVLKKSFENGQHDELATSSDDCDMSQPLVYSLKDKKCNNNSLKLLKDQVDELKLLVETKKKDIERSNDPDLQSSIQILNKRNAALLKRYERQLQEVENRHRQKLSELNSLQQLLMEKTTHLNKLKTS